MPIKICGNSNPDDNGNKNNTSLFVQKPYSRIKYMEANIEKDIEKKSQYTIRNLPDPKSIGEAISKNYVDHKFTNPRIIKKPSMLVLTIKISILCLLLK